MTDSAAPTPLRLRGCALTALSTGIVANDLRELHGRILEIPSRSLYYHFWGRKLRPVLEEQDYMNDFAQWVGRELRDPYLAERLALVDPWDEADLETLRGRISGLLEARIAEGGFDPCARPEDAFHFLEGQMVIFDVGAEVRDPEEMATVLPGLPQSSLYYHLIDARHRTPIGMDDFQQWLGGWGNRYQRLIDALDAVDVYFTPLPLLHEELTGLFRRFAKVAA